MGLDEQVMECEHAAAEDAQFGALVAQALQLRRFEGGGLAKHPCDDPGFNRFVTDGGEWGVVVHKK
jgi:hypothetical protein